MRDWGWIGELEGKGGKGEKGEWGNGGFREIHKIDKELYIDSDQSENFSPIP
jgi:hypothetical protein